MRSCLLVSIDQYSFITGIIFSLQGAYCNFQNQAAESFQSHNCMIGKKPVIIVLIPSRAIFVSICLLALVQVTGGNKYNAGHLRLVEEDCPRGQDEQPCGN